MRTKILDDYLYTTVKEDISPSGEINEQVNYVESMFKFLDSSAESLTDLERIGDIIEEHEVGECDLSTMKLVSVSLNHTYKRLGIDHTQYRLSKEAFDNQGIRKIEFEMTAEGVGSAVRSGWDSLVEFFKKIMAKISELWKTYTKATEHLKMLVKNARQKLLSYNASPDVDDTFNDKSIAVALKIGDQLAITDQIQNTLKLCSVVFPVNQFFTKKIEEVKTDTATGETTKQIKSELNIAKSLGNVAGSIIEITDKTEKNTLPNIKDSNRLLGNGVVVAYIGEGENLTIDIEKIMYNKDVEDFSLEVAHKEDMNRYLGSILKIILNIEQIRNKTDSDSKRTLNELNEIEKKMKQINKDKKKAKANNQNAPKPNAGNNAPAANQNNQAANQVQGTESYNLSSEDDNKNNGPAVTDGKLEIDKDKVKSGEVSYSKTAIKNLKELIKAKGKVSYLSTKLMIDGCYKLISYIDKSLAYYNKESNG